MSKKNYVLKIVDNPEKLSTRCDEIDISKNLSQVKKIVKELKDTILANKDMVALSAPQLGYPYRIFCIRFADENVTAFVNPMVTKIEGKSLNIENINCLPDAEFMLQRSQRVMAGYQMPNGQYNELSLRYPVSAVFEQMLDIIDGTLFFKYETIALPIDKDYYKASPEEKEELHKWYFDTYLPEKLKLIQAEADKDEDIKKLQDQIKYFTSIIEGKTEIVPVYGEEVDLENSSLKVKEEEDKVTKEYIEGLKKNLGVK